MDSRTGLLLLFLLRVVGSAPLESDDLSVLRETAQRAQTLVEKILSDVPQVHRSVVTAEGLSLDPPSLSSLQTMVASLGIPPPPVLKPLSEHFSLEESVSRMLSGVHVLEQLLLVLSEQVFGLTELQADLRDLLTHLTKMTTATQIKGFEQTSMSHLSSRLHGDYEVQVAAHVTLTQLRFFCRDLIRSLRAVATYKPSSVSHRSC
uniref:Uncharacterized LOC114468471 n=1 Tax=Gouania willdenowi TaxID=441366 RepID=A0A8C5EEN8_GOUWI